MKQTLNTSIEKINHLDRKSLEEYLISEQALPNSDEKVFNIGYALLKLDRLDEAFSFFEKLPSDYFKEFFSFLGKLSDNCFEQTNIFLTGYYKGCDGNWHDYDDSCNLNSDDDDCCSLLCSCLCLSGCSACCCDSDTYMNASKCISHCLC